MIRINKFLLFSLGSLITVGCLFLLCLDVWILLEGDSTENQLIGSVFFWGTLPFVGFGGALLAYRNRPRRREKAPIELIDRVRSLLLAKGGHASLTSILGSLEYTHDEIHAALHVLKKKRQGEIRENQYGENEFVLMPRSFSGGKSLRRFLRGFIIRSSKVRMTASFVFALGCAMLLVVEQGNPCCGPAGYYIIMVVSSMVIISCSYIISYFKKRMGK